MDLARVLQSASNGTACHGRAASPEESDTGFADEENMPKLALPDLELGARSSPSTQGMRRMERNF